MSAAKGSHRGSESGVITFRLAHDELEFLDDQAGKFGLSRSAFLRFLISLSPELVSSYEKAFSELEGEPVLVIPMVYQVDLDEMKAELRKQGVNLNQAVKALNMIARSAYVRKVDELPLLLKEVRRSLDNIAELYNEFDDEFFDFTEHTATLGTDGYVCT